MKTLRRPLPTLQLVYLFASFYLHCFCLHWFDHKKIADDEGIAIRVIGDHYMSEGMNTLPSQRGQALCPEALKWFYCLRIACI